jgi:hypothetical protein
MTFSLSALSVAAGTDLRAWWVARGPCPRVPWSGCYRASQTSGGEELQIIKQLGIRLQQPGAGGTGKR